MWFTDDDRSGERAGRNHTVLVWGGFIALALAAFVLVHGTTMSQWPTAQAKVLSVEVRCSMTTSEHGRRNRPVTVFIPCAEIEKFRADNSDRAWRQSKVYSGQIRVTRDGTAVTVNSGLPQTGHAPQVGDVFDVLQNPESPTDIQFADRSLAEIGLGIFLGGLGIFLLVWAFVWV